MPSSGAAHGTAEPAPYVAMVPLRDAASRMFLLTRLIAAFDEGDHGFLAHLLGSGFTPELIDRLRQMSMVDALRFSAEHCGVAISVDSVALQRQMHNLERRRADRETYEYLIRAGASPPLLCDLFRVSNTEVRRLRKIIAPGVVAGGRPRLPDLDTCLVIVRHWEQICVEETSERQRYVRLHKALDGAHLVATLETVLEDHRQRMASMARRSAADTRPRLVAFGAPQAPQFGGHGAAVGGA